MKKKFISLMSFILTATMLFSVGCGENSGETPNNPSTGNPVVTPPLTGETGNENENENENENGNENGGETGGETGGTVEEPLYFPEYAPDPVPTEKITAHPARISGAISSRFHIVIDNDGKLWGWGENDYGQVGNGDQTGILYDGSVHTPQKLETDSSVKFSCVSSARRFALALDENNHLWGWGNFEDPEPGKVERKYYFLNTEYDRMSTSTTYIVPTQLMLGKKYKYVSAGNDSCYLIDKYDRLWFWGKAHSDFGGELTVGERKDGAVHVLKDKTFASVYTYNTVTYAIDTDGKLWGWGDTGLANQVGRKLVEIMPERKFVRVTSRGDSGRTYAIDENGNLWGWGSNNQGQLGDGTKTTQTAPVQIMKGKYFTYVATKADNSYAIDVQGKTWVWGFESPVLNAKYYPQEVQAKVKFLQVADGIAIDENGEIWTWGDNINGQLGNGENQNILTPQLVFEDMCFVKVGFCTTYTYALDQDGHLWGWGGDGFRNTENSLKLLMKGKKVKDFSVSGHRLVIDVEGNLWAWGANSQGQVGDGTTKTREEPVQIMPGKKFIKVSAGLAWSHAIDMEGNLWAWGGGGSDGTALGLGVSEQHTPAQVMKGVKFVQVSSGTEHVMAIDVDGNLWGWGNNKGGAMGKEKRYNLREPEIFRAGNTFSQMAFFADLLYDVAGNYLIDTAGKLYARGTGIDIVVNSDTGLQLENKTFSSVARGRFHALALDVEGRICIWGYNTHGQIGLLKQETKLHILDYQIVMPEKKFVFVAADEASSAAIDTDGKLWVWGSNNCGILNGVRGVKDVPQKIILK